MIEIVNLHKTFNKGTSNEVNALSGIHCTIEEGSFVVLLGTNGSGKSTLLSAIAGSFLPDAGMIKLDGNDISRMPEHKRARFIGRVFQNPFMGTAPEMSIAENLAMASRRGRKRLFSNALPKKLRHEFETLVKPLNMDLEARLDNAIGKLSGGQRQALTLLMATLIKPKVLLLDEHTAALDPKTANKVIQLTEELIGRDQLTTMMVTHSMQQAVKMGDRILLLHKGTILHDFSGQDKKRLKTADLLALFDDIRKKEQIDPSAAELFRTVYV